VIIPVNREQLIAVVKANRAKHEAIFKEAVEGYRKVAIEKLEEYIRQVRDGDQIVAYWQMPVPEEHTDEYDRVIGLLEMSTQEEVDMSDVEYQSYVLDSWRWKDAFLASNSYYSSTAKALAGGGPVD